MNSPRLTDTSIKEIIFKRMELLMLAAVKEGLSTSRSAWLEEIGVAKQNWRKLVSGELTYTHEQIRAAVEMLGTSYDFVYGKTKYLRRL